MTIQARNYIDNAPTVQVTSALTAGDTSIPVTAVTGFPTVPFWATIDLGLATSEQVLVTAVAGSSFTVTRNANGQGAYTHSSGANFQHTAVAQDYNEANAHTRASAGVHGVVGPLVGTTDVQALTNKTLTSPTVVHASHQGDSTHPVILGSATDTGGKLLSLLDNAATERISVDDAGNLHATGNVASDGTVTAGWLAGKLQVSGTTTEAALTALIPSPASGEVVWVSAPTNGRPGLYFYDGTTWQSARFDRTFWQAHNSATVSLLSSSTFSPVAVNTIDFDSRSYGVAGGGLTVTEAGTYKVWGVVEFDGSPNAARGVGIGKNGTLVASSRVLTSADSSGFTALPSAPTYVTCSASDVLTLMALQNTGSSMTLPAASSFLSVERVS